MALASEAQGTQTATVGTEHTLSAPTTNKVRVFRVDLANMVNGDVLELRIKTKVLTGGTERIEHLATFANIQAAPIVSSIPISTLFGGTFTLKQVAGTSRNFDWAVYTLD